MRASGIVSSAAILLLLLLATGGCDFSSVEPDPPVLLQGTLTPTAAGGAVGGSAAAVTQFGRTEASIRATGLDTDRLYLWRLREGSCAGSGTSVAGPAAFPPLAPDLDGEAGEEAVFDIPLRPERFYAVEVEDGEEELGVVACADMLEAS